MIVKSENLYPNIFNAVMIRMRPPCEVVVTKVLPAIRTVLVKDLVNRHDLSQKEVAEKLGVTQAAVSQYLSSTRGDEDVERKLRDSESHTKIQDLSDKIASGTVQRSQIIEEYCKICDSMRSGGTLCAIHADSSPLEEGCDMCLDAEEEGS